MRLLHRHFRPRTYVEIGVGSGRSMARARPETRCVGVDPEPMLRHELPESAEVFASTSDDFFRAHDVKAIVGGPVELAFIDGMHLFEFALRDFIQLERAASAQSVIAIHDCYPPNATVAARERATEFWTGDVWKLIPCLAKYRPDLRVMVVDVPPSGLAVVTNLDPGSLVLEDRYTDLCQEFMDLEYDGLGEAKAESLNVIPADWEVVRRRLPPAVRPDRMDRTVG